MPLYTKLNELSKNPDPLKNSLRSLADQFLKTTGGLSRFAHGEGREAATKLRADMSNAKSFDQVLGGVETALKTETKTFQPKVFDELIKQLEIKFEKNEESDILKIATRLATKKLESTSGEFSKSEAKKHTMLSEMYMIAFEEKLWVSGEKSHVSVSSAQTKTSDNRWRFGVGVSAPGFGGSEDASGERKVTISEEVKQELQNFRRDQNIDARHPDGAVAQAYLRMKVRDHLPEATRQFLRENNIFSQLRGSRPMNSLTPS